MVWASAALCVGLTFAAADPVDLTINLPPKSVIDYRLEVSETNDEGAWETTTSRFHVEVTRTGDKTFEARWTDTGTPEGETLVFQTDEALVPVQTVNIDAVRAAMSAHLESDHTSAEETDAGLAMLRGMSNETLTSLIAKDFILTSFGQGTNLIPGQIERYDQPSGTFGDGEPLIMNASFLLESVQQASGLATVVWTNEIDPETAGKALAEIIGDFLGLANIDTSEAETKLAAAMRGGRFMKRTECRYQIAIETGLAVRSECHEVQEVTLEGESRREERRVVATQALIS